MSIVNHTISSLLPTPFPAYPSGQRHPCLNFGQYLMISSIVIRTVLSIIASLTFHSFHSLYTWQLSKKVQLHPPCDVHGF